MPGILARLLGRFLEIVNTEHGWELKNRNLLYIATLITSIIGSQLVSGWFSPAFSSPLTELSVTPPGTTTANEYYRETPLLDLAERRYIRLSGGWEWQDGPTGEKNLAVSRYNDATIEGTFTGNWLELYARLKGQSFDLQLDGNPASHLTMPDTGQYGYFRIINGPKRAQYKFRLRLTNRAGGSLEALTFRTNGRWKLTRFATRPSLMGFGSSTMDFCGIEWGLAEAKGWETLNRGIGGTTVTNQGQYRVERDVLPFQPDVVLINYGSNDWYGKIPLDRFEAAYLNMLNQLAAGLPDTRFVVLGLFPRSGGDEVSRAQFNKAIQAAIVASPIKTRTQYVEVKGYDYKTDSLDGTHPNPQAVATKFVPQLLPLLGNGTKPIS